MRPLAAPLILALAGARPLAGQSVACEPTATISECVQRAVDAPRPRAQARATDSTTQHTSAARSLDRKVTGAESSVDDNATAISNFLPRLSAALAAPGLSDADRRALGLRLNFPLYRSLVNDLGPTGQVELVLNHPTVFERIGNGVTSARRATVADSLQKTLGDVDDVTLTAAANVESRRFGRGWRQHADEVSRIAGAIMQDADDHLNAALGGVARRAMVLRDSTDRLPARRDAAECREKDARLDCFAPARRAELTAAANAYVAASSDFRDTVRARFAAFGFARLADLVNNQPQLSASLAWRLRDALAGPTTVTARLRYEMGRANLNALRDWCTAHETRRVDDDVTAACLASFVRLSGVAGSLDRSERFWLALSGNYQPRYEYALPSDAVDIRLGASWSAAADAGYGQYLGPATDAGNRARIDWQLGYVLEQQNAPRESRLTSRLQLTQPFTGEIGSYVALVYANKPEYLGEVDRKLRANLGLSYKLPAGEAVKR